MRADVLYPEGSAVVTLTGDVAPERFADALAGTPYSARVRPGAEGPARLDAAVPVGAAVEAPVGPEATSPVRAGTGGGDPYDLVVVGAGSAGFSAAIRAVESGGRVALVHDGTLGGTCVNVGCVPSKALIRAAERGR